MVHNEYIHSDIGLHGFVSTKFQPPSCADDFVYRTHLLDYLNNSRQRKLVLIKAPAGYGKTTLAVQWRNELQQDGFTVPWLSLDEDDNDLLRFLSYMVAAIGREEPSIALDLVSVLETHPESATAFVLGSLINNIYEVDRDIYLMLDDWHLIYDEKVQKTFRYFLTHAPANLHFVLISRHKPQCGVPRLRVEGQVVEVGAEDLSFDMEESRVFLQDIRDLKFPAEALTCLWRATDGWVAALQLASLSFRSGMAPDAIIDSLSARPGAIGDYLAENVLDSLPRETVGFLLRTSILERLNGSLCAAVSGLSDSQRILEDLERQDLFIRPLDERREWFRYHHLFSAYLRHKLIQTFPHEVGTLHLRACRWFAEAHYTVEAVSHALTGGGVDQAVDLIERDAMWLVEHSRMATLLSLVKRVPRGKLSDRPWLQIAVAWAHCLTHHSDAAQGALDLMKECLAGRNALDEHDKEELMTEARVVQGAIHIYGDRILAAKPLVKPCIDCAGYYRPWVVAVATNILTYVALHSFQFDHARDLQKWARYYHDRTQGPFSDVYGRCFTGMADMFEGRLRRARNSFREAAALAAKTTGRHSHAARLAGALWGRMKYEYCDLQGAEELLEESRALGTEGGVADFSLATYTFLARLKAMHGDFAGAHALIGEGLETADHVGLGRLTAALNLERVRLHLMQGEVHLAERLVLCNPSQKGERADGIEVLVSECRRLATARVFYAQGNLEPAEELIRELVESAEGAKRYYAAVGLRVFWALIINEMGNSEVADDVLLVALRRGSPEGMIRTFLDEGEPILVLLRRLREKIRHGTLPVRSELVVRHIGHLLGIATIEDGAPQLREVPETEKEACTNQYMGYLPSVEPLKEREHQILLLLSNGCSNKEIARTLGLGANTVKWYLKHIYSKLCVNRRTQAVVEAKRLRIL